MWNGFQGDNMPKYYESYAGSDQRRAMEERDAKMLGGGGIANMPQGVVYSQWPKAPINGPEGLNDGISGIDRQMRDDLKGKKGPNSEKY